MDTRKKLRTKTLGWLVGTLLLQPALLQAQKRGDYDKVWYYSGSNKEDPDNWERHKIISEVNFEIAHERQGGQYAVYGKWKVGGDLWEFNGTYYPKTGEIKAHLGNDPLRKNNAVDGNVMKDNKGFYMVAWPPNEPNAPQLHVTCRLTSVVGSTSEDNAKLQPDANTKFFTIVSFEAPPPDNDYYRRHPEPPECHFERPIAASAAESFDGKRDLPLINEELASLDRSYYPNPHAIYFSSREEGERWFQQYRSNLRKCGDAKDRSR